MYMALILLPNFDSRWVWYYVPVYVIFICGQTLSLGLIKHHAMKTYTVGRTYLSKRSYTRTSWEKFICFTIWLQYSLLETLAKHWAWEPHRTCEEKKHLRTFQESKPDCHLTNPKYEGKRTSTFSRGRTVTTSKTIFSLQYYKGNGENSQVLWVQRSSKLRIFLHSPFVYTKPHTTPVIRVKYRSDIQAKKSIEWHTSVTWTDIKAKLNLDFCF
jgi:hypothetical protein